jgi:hypothetical protein
MMRGSHCTKILVGRGCRSHQIESKNVASHIHSMFTTTILTGSRLDTIREEAVRKEVKLDRDEVRCGRPLWKASHAERT